MKVMQKGIRVGWVSQSFLALPTKIYCKRAGLKPQPTAQTGDILQKQKGA